MQTKLFGQVLPQSVDQQIAAQKKGKGSSELGQQEFLNLLITQLKNQDPLSPMDSADFTSQTTAFSQLDEMMNMNKAMQQMLEMSTQQSNNNNSLFAASNFIGKEIEYKTNTVTLGEDKLANISFYLPEAPAGITPEVRVYNTDGDLVSIIQPQGLTKGANTFVWDGKGVGGTEVADGLYAFEVTAYGADGKKMSVEEYGKAIVTGVKTNNGVVYFDVGTGIVSSEYVYAVKDAPKKEEPEKPTDKPSDDKEDNKEDKSSKIKA